MIKKFLKSFSGRHYRKFIKECKPIVERINSLEKEYQSWTEEKLKANTELFKERLKNGESLDALLPEAFATAKNAARRLCGQKITVCDEELTWNMVHYDVQLIGGIAMHRGYIAEMATGEGKTLVSTLPLYLNALTDRNCQLVTVNDYLARRDSEWNGYLYNYLGISVGCIQHDMPHEDRVEAYKQNITYGTASEFGFDYLRDNGMVGRKEDQVQREHYFCIVDEIDSVLVDEARTPLIISGEAEDTSVGPFLQLKPGIEKLFELQKKLCNRLAQEAVELSKSTDKNDQQACLDKLFCVKQGMPQNSTFLRLMEEGDVRKKFDKFDGEMSAEFNKDQSYELKESLFFTIDERQNQSDLTEKGRNTLHPQDPDAFVLPDLPSILSELDANVELSEEKKIEVRQKAEEEFAKKSEEIHCISQLLRAYCLYNKDDQYIVVDGKVVIIDENTGRAMSGRRWSDGLHQAVEAKEGVSIEKETKTYATITIQNYFRMYEKLSGMTGTAETEAQEFYDIYRLKVMVIPTHRPCIRIDNNDVIYKSRRSKYKAALKDIEEAHKKGQPVLVGTVSVEASELLSRMLKKAGIVHSVLNAKFHQQEAEIVKRAGQEGAVTIATNMAGRGTDIKLGENVDKVGGLFVLGTERHESRRIDRQLRGRCSRQGDPGRSKFFISLEDNLMRLFASSGPIGRFLEKSMEEDEELTHPILNRSIGSAQKKVEQHNYSIRKRLLEYDNVLNRQREIIYSIRNEAITIGKSKEIIFDFIEEELDQKIQLCTDNIKYDEEQSIKNLLQWVNLHFPVFLEKQHLPPIKDTENFQAFIFDKIKQIYEEKSNAEGDEHIQEIERYVVVSSIDKLWQSHLTEMEDLRQSVGLRGYGQKDPLNEYKNEAYGFFENMMENIRQEVCFNLFRATTNIDQLKNIFSKIAQKAKLSGFEDEEDNIQADSEDIVLPQPVKLDLPKVGRNDQCPCGSNKKYKKCCGAN